MKLKELKNIFNKELENLYLNGESQTILNYILIDALGIPKLTIISQPQLELDNNQSEKVLFLLNELKKGKPIQYLLGTAHFYGMILKINPDVLIPRPETEELVDWIIKDNKGREKIKILDVCTGSGCIALALKKHLPEATVTAIDISEKALDVAKRNAQDLELDVKFKKGDALNLEQELCAGIPLRKDESFDIIVSNPPYIPISDKNTVQKNVFMYEPHSALFVPDETPLLFYESIAQYAKKSNPVILYFEINEDSGDALTELLTKLEFRDINIRIDLNEKNRMLKCSYFN